MAYTSEIEKLERRWNENPLGLTFAPLAEAYRKAGDHTRALELLELGLAQHPNYVPAHIVRGRCHLDTAAEDAAELAFLRVVELDPENAIALKSLAEICERTGRLPEAMRRLEMLLDVDRTNEEARQQLERVRGLAASPAAAPPVPPSAPVPPSLPEPTPPTSSTSWLHAPEPPAPAPEPVSPPAAAADEDDLGDLAVFEPESLSTSLVSEFQLPSDAESLQPTGDRLADIVLGSEIPEQSLPLQDSATGQDMIAPPDAAVAGTAPLPGAELAEEPIVPEVGAASEEAALAEPLEDAVATPTAWSGSMFEPATAETPALPAAEAAPSEPEGYIAEQREFITAADEPVAAEPSLVSNAMFAIPSEPVPESAPAESLLEEEVVPVEPDLVPVGASLGDVEAPAAAAPPSEPPFEEAESPAEPTAPAFAEASEAESDDEPLAPAAEPELVVTESMAEVFLRQGHRELALAVYTQLAQRDPANARVAEAADRLRAELAPPPPPPAPAPRFDAAATGGVSVGHRLGGLFAAARPAVAAPVHPPAFEAPSARRAGEPTRPSDDSLSLSAVFGEEAAASPVGPVSAPAESSDGEPSFDEFFSSEQGAAELPSAPPPAPEAAGAPSQSGEDLERFNAWLRNLKS